VVHNDFRIILFRHIHTTTTFWYYYIFLVYHSFLQCKLLLCVGYMTEQNNTKVILGCCSILSLYFTPKFRMNALSLVLCIEAIHWSQSWCSDKWLHGPSIPKDHELSQIYIYLIILGGLVFIVLDIGPKVRGFRPGRERWILRVINIRRKTSVIGEE
jgi:hypothetical protein